MKKLLAVTMLCVSAAASAGGWTSTGADDGSVIFIEVVRAQGFLVKGNFGNPAGCTVTNANHIWVDISHPQYDQLYATALAAFMGGKKIKAYVHNCTDIGWHGGTFNSLNGAGAMYLKH